MLSYHSCILVSSYLCPRHLSLQVAGHPVHGRAPGQLGVGGGEPLRQPVQLLAQLPGQLQAFLQLQFTLSYLHTQSKKKDDSMSDSDSYLTVCVNQTYL